MKHLCFSKEVSTKLEVHLLCTSIDQSCLNSSLNQNTDPRNFTALKVQLAFRTMKATIIVTFEVLIVLVFKVSSN